MPFFCYHQNNSGGSFIVDDQVDHYVIVEADSRDDADSRAEAAGIYFDGCHEGRDCECCGDRWCRSYGEGFEKPGVWESGDIEEYEGVRVYKKAATGSH